MRITKEQKIKIESILKEMNFPEGLTFKQIMKIFWWDFFNHKRMKIFFDSLESGKSMKFAFKDAENKK